MPLSLSEDQGIAFLTSSDLKIYSVGISTSGSAEIRMAFDNSGRHITATTIDPEGATFAKNQIQKASLSNQITVKIEDVAKPLSYPDTWFDAVYARLVLHYLSNADLERSLKELHRILRPGGKIFVVVRSKESAEANVPSATFDPKTGFTSYSIKDCCYQRNFHSEESIQEFLKSAGFCITSTQSYEEQLYVDFQRTVPSKYIDMLIEVTARANNFLSE